MKFNKTVELPFLIYLGRGSSNLLADNKVYESKYNYTIEYYFNLKDERVEKDIEQLFNDNNIPWEKSEDIFISEENMYLIRYEI